MDDLNGLIFQQLKAINKDAGEFVAGILSDDISRMTRSCPARSAEVPVSHRRRGGRPALL